MIEPSALILPAFIAGVLTFLAPCTLPLVPAYLGFISGVSANDLKDPEKVKSARVKIFVNGLFFVIGITVIFVAFGTLSGFLGASFAVYRLWLERIGGVLIIIFGLYMLRVISLPFLPGGGGLPAKIPFKPGNPFGSLLLGSSFAVGWTPCVGPILGSILLLAATSSTAAQGGFLLFIFSMGLAIPFLLIALAYGSASSFLARSSRYLRWTEIIGGIFLIGLGVLVATGNFALLVSYGFEIFRFLEYERILDYL